MKRAAAVVAVLSVVAAACADDGAGGPDKLRDDVPDPPEGGVQLVTPTFQVAPGEELFVCYRIDHVVDRDWYVINSTAYQMPNGHHTFVYFMEGDTSAIDPAPHECGSLDMTNIRVAASGGADGASFFIADDVALLVPRGAELWAQSHYINATDQARTVQDVVNLTLVEPSAVREVASTFAQVDLTFALPPGEETVRTVECAPHQDMTVPWLLPHMHQWGNHYSIEIIDPEGQITWSSEGDWAANLRNDFRVVELEQHLSLTPQHRLRTTCRWFNDEAETLLFPQEMCVTFFPFYPGDGALWACDESGDVFRP